MIVMASKGHLKSRFQLNEEKSPGSHALFDANTATYAKELGYERDLVCGFDLDTELALAINVS
jgi:hypothetical protein